MLQDILTKTKIFVLSQHCPTTNIWMSVRKLTNFIKLHPCFVLKGKNFLSLTNGSVVNPSR